MTERKKSSWLKLFTEFVGDIRIASKEVVTDDPRGAPLEMWESQKRSLREIGNGLDAGIHKFNILKSRQLGITTVTLAIDVFWLAMHRNTIGCLVTDTEKNRDANRMLLEHYVESFPEGYFGDEFRIVKSNRQFLLFSNGCRLDLLVAGVKRKAIAWGQGQGYMFAHLTEIGNYADPEGVKSLEEGFAQKNPNRLFIFESTAKGMNHWRARWMAGAANNLTERSFFIGWWAGDTNRIERSDPLFSKYGTYQMTAEERQKCRAVLQLYDHKVTPEQLAWIRWREHNAGAEQDLHQQNQPWTAEEAFVQTGYSFFQSRKIGQDLKRLADERRPFKAYCYSVDGDFYSFSMEQLLSKADAHRIELKVWEEPMPNGRYVIGFDPAYGRNEHGDCHCLDDTAEILTKEGWKTYDQIQIGDVAVCFDHTTEEYSYGAVQNVIVKDHDGDAYHFHSRGLDFVTTPEHRVLTRNYRRLRSGDKPAWQFKTAEHLSEGGANWREIPIGGAVIGPGIEDLSLDMCRAIGWILTDGHMNVSPYLGNGAREGKLRKRPYIVLAQSLDTNKGPVNVAQEMRDVMLKLCPNATIKERPATESQSAQVVIRINVKDAEVFAPWLSVDSDRIPRRILEEGSRAQLEALFQGIAEGDGSWHKRLGWIKISTGLDKGLSDDVQELALKIGYSPSQSIQPPAEEHHHQQYLLNIARRKTHSYKVTDAIDKIHYKGKVWCVTVPTGAFVARRNGKVFVTGNCITVFRCFADKVVQVAEYCTNDVEAKHASWVLFHLCAAYVDVMANVELGGPGRLVMMEFDHLRQLISAEMNHSRTQAKNWEDAASQARWFLYKRVDSPGPGYVANFESSFKTKMELLHGLRGAFMSNELEIWSKSLLLEMQNVVQDGDTIGAPESTDEDKKDDRVFALALAVRAWSDWIRRDMLAQGLTYERVMKEENEDTSVIEKSVNNQVYRFLAGADVEPEPERGPAWMVQRGLM